MGIRLPQQTLNFFKGDELRARVFIEKYALKTPEMKLLEKTPKQMWKRVAKAIADMEQTEEKKQEWYKKFYEILEDFKFVPAGRILAGAGDPYRRKTPFNCYVIEIEDDSIEGIFKALYESARTYSYGGGIGLDISVLRPKNSIVHNAASKSTGAVSFMNLFSEVTGTIGQDGRRGALMLTIRIDHPDAPDFITIKNDPERRNVRYANISVRITDEFMKAVENDEEFTLWFENEVVGRIEKKIRAKELWNKIVENAWASAEPGILFWDRVKSESPSEYFAPIVSCNPCIPKGSLLLDGNRLRKIEDGGNNWISWKTGIKEVIELICSNGLKLQFTPDHLVMLENGTFVEAKDTLGKKLKWELYDFQRKGITKLDKDFLIKGFKFEGYQLDDEVMFGDDNQTGSFLQGFFETNGLITNKWIEVEFLEHQEKLVQQIQLLLLSFGIYSWIDKEESKYKLYIHPNDLQKFSWSIGFYSETKKELLNSLIKRNKEIDRPRTIEVVDIKSVGKKEVWDFKMNTPPHYNFCQGIIAHNCSEQPLEDGGACCLGSVNLAKFVNNPFTDEAEVDWGNLEKTIRYSVRFLDNVVEYGLDKQPLPKQKRAAEMGRRIGLGVMGLADILIMLKIKYDSQEALEFLDEFFDRFKNIAYQESTLIAKEKGSFKAFDYEKHMQCPFVQRLWNETKEMIKENGLRNVALLSIAPTGSISTMAGVSGGIEPIFAFSYIRRSESLSQSEFKVYHPLVKDYMKLTGIKDESELPDYFVQAYKIDPYYRVKLQGIIQRHIESAISSTVNLPSDTTPQVISDIYFEAWKAGCKGITVYRAGSREGILLTENEKKEKNSEEKQEQKKEKEHSVVLSDRQDVSNEMFLDAKRIKVKTPQGSMYLLVAFDKNNDVKEVFAHIGKSGADEKANAEAIGRLISLCLQLGGNVWDVIKTLENIQGRDVMWYKGVKIYSIPDAIAKGLKFLLEEKAEKVKEQQAEFGVCPMCGEQTLIRENGCMKCINCLYSKCE